MSNQPTIEAPKKKTGLFVAIAVVVVALIAAIVYFVTRDSDDTAADDGSEPLETVRLGTVGGDDPYWETFVAAAAEEGIDLQVVNFTEYTQPNPALADGELDINQFQHIVYLADYNVSNNQDLVPVGSTAIYPLGLYSLQYDSVEDIEDGDTVAVPNDPSNRARALLILQSAGLIELEGGGSIFSDLSEIDTANSRVEVTELNAEVTATSLQDVAAAVINNDFVERAGLEFDDAIAQDDPSDPNALPYVNIFATRAEDKDNETLLKLVEIYQNTQEILDGVDEVSGGTAEFLQIPVSDLEQSLATVEDDVRANS